MKFTHLNHHHHLKRQRIINTFFTSYFSSQHVD